MAKVAAESLPAMAQCAFPRTGKRGVPQQFPRRLYDMLNSEAKAAQEDNHHAKQHVVVISWSPSGKAFRIYNVKEFASTILPKYFRTTKFSSFQRNLNLYGFEKARRGADSDMYSHPSFQRDHPEELIELRKVNHSAASAVTGGSPTLMVRKQNVIGTSLKKGKNNSDDAANSTTSTFKTTNRVRCTIPKKIDVKRTKTQTQMFRETTPAARSVSPTISSPTSSASSTPHQSPSALREFMNVNYHDHPPQLHKAIVYPLRTAGTGVSSDQRYHVVAGTNHQVYQEPYQIQQRRFVPLLRTKNILPTKINRIPCDRPSYFYNDHKTSLLNTIAQRPEPSITAVNDTNNKTSTVKTTSTSDRGHLDLLAFVMEYDYLKSSCP